MGTLPFFLFNVLLGIPPGDYRRGGRPGKLLSLFHAIFYDELLVHLFHRDISFGKGHTQDLRAGKLPSIVDVPAWDGQDMPLPDEEDIDLSDVDLDDEEKGKDEL